MKDEIEELLNLNLSSSSESDDQTEQFDLDLSQVNFVHNRGSTISFDDDSNKGRRLYNTQSRINKGRKGILIENDFSDFSELPKCLS